ncbi:MAG: hypothetical protein JWR50_2517 [Mucilaginibacter sp.]|nr:hypothetical protein [Mucilaginibacter sp.]
MKRILLLIFTAVSIHTAYAQDQSKPVSGADIKKVADSKKFKFNAVTATLAVDADHTSGSSGTSGIPDNHYDLTGSYYAALSPDSVASYLPFYDKSKTEAAGENSTTTVLEDPNRSLAATYDYQVKEKKDGKVNITIKPKADTDKASKYVFELAPDGTAKLELTVNNYKVITYTGTVTAM